MTVWISSSISEATERAAIWQNLRHPAFCQNSGQELIQLPAAEACKGLEALLIKLGKLNTYRT